MRRGISLMEVLISIGIMAIGMLSIASLLPVGNMQVQRAYTEERKAELGLNVVQEFQIRGMSNPGNWLKANGSAVSIAKYDPISKSYSPAEDGYNTPPLAIDPLMVAVGGASVDVMPANAVSGAPTMKRLGLSVAMSRPLAEMIFTLTNDLVTIQPEDRTLPGRAPDATEVAEAANRRPFEGKFTWLATLTPGELNPDVATITPGNTYTLSIAIFDSRFLNANPHEQMVTATGGGIGGGDFVFSDPSTTKLDSVKPGQWIMLCRNEPWGILDLATRLMVPQTPRPVFKWYRVSNVGEQSKNGSNYEMDVSLIGRDWDSSIIGTTYACIFEDTVAVYERSIHLDSGTSIWSQ